MARFAIVIPCSQSVSTLDAAIASALRQDFSDFQVYVSDNASTDGTREYLQTLSDPKLVVSSHAEKVSKTENWNRAFRTAPRCDIFVMLHSDDLLYPRALTQIDAVFHSNPRSALVYGNHDILSLDGEKVTQKRMWPRTYISRDFRCDRLQVLNNAVSIVGCAFPREFYEKIGGFSEQFNFYQDMEFFHSLSQLGSAIYTPFKFGLNRGAPVRPQSRLAFYCEEITWLQRRVQVWPKWFGGMVCQAWIRDAGRHLHRDHPELVAEYSEHVLRSGFRPPKITVHKIGFPRITIHQLYKSWLTLRSLEQIPRNDRQRQQANRFGFKL